MWHVAVVGSGPAGVYAADALLKADPHVHVDVLDRLPSPFGLVRYGVAPDHPKIKSIATTLARTLTDPRVRFVGNINVGLDLGTDDLEERYSAVIYAVGAPTGNRLGIPGEELPGSISGVELVNWYSGHPDSSPGATRLDTNTAVIIGAGNVALDAARILTMPPSDLRRTDVPPHVLQALQNSPLSDVHLVMRRGPAHAKFTTPELREIGSLDSVVVRVDPADLAGASEHARSPATQRNLAVLSDWAGRSGGDGLRRIHFHFWTRPIEVIGSGHVTALSCERNVSASPDHASSVTGTGASISTISTGLLISCIGYRGSPLPGLPFDHESGRVPNKKGRVHHSGARQPGTYVAGWIKRGPNGVIGTNKKDAAETVGSLMEDRASGLLRRPSTPSSSLTDLLRERGIKAVPWAGWANIQEAEARFGLKLGRDVVKISSWPGLLAAAQQ